MTRIAADRTDERTNRGTTIENRAPVAGKSSADTVPPAAASRPRAIDRPIPVPVVCLARTAAIKPLEQVVQGPPRRFLVQSRDTVDP